MPLGWIAVAAAIDESLHGVSLNITAAVSTTPTDHNSLYLVTLLTPKDNTY